MTPGLKYLPLTHTLADLAGGEESLITGADCSRDGGDRRGHGRNERRHGRRREVWRSPGAPFFDLHRASHLCCEQN